MSKILCGLVMIPCFVLCAMVVCDKEFESKGSILISVFIGLLGAMFGLFGFEYISCALLVIGMVSLHISMFFVKMEHDKKMREYREY